MNIFYQQQAFIFILYTMVKDMNTGGRGRKEKPWGIPTSECLNEHLAYGGGEGNDSQLNRLYVQVCTRYKINIFKVLENDLKNVSKRSYPFSNIKI
jgi:hypothetical protein